MAEGVGSKEPEVQGTPLTRNGELKDGTTATTASVEEDEGEEDDDDDEEDEEEPRLKYIPITKRLTSLYRNGDAVSTFLVAGDKMVRDRIPAGLWRADIPLTGQRRLSEVTTAILY